MILEKSHKTYIPNFQHDVFISFADEDAQWTQDLSEYLRKQLKQRLGTADDFQLYSGNDFSQLSQSALLLIIASPEYCQHYAAQFEKIGSLLVKNVFLVELVCMPRPEVLKRFTLYKFWHYDDNEGMMSLMGEAYISKANNLSTAIAKRLIDLKEEKQQQQNLIQKQRVQQERWVQKNIRSTTNTTNTTYAKALTWVKKQQTSAPSVFISYAWGMKTQVRWVKELAMDIKEAGIEVILDDWDNSSLGGSVARFINHISTCDFVVVVGTPQYLDKSENKVSELGSVVAAEVDLITRRLLATEAHKATVIPLLLEGREDTALPPLLRGRVYGDFRDAGSYIPNLFDLILTLYHIEPCDSSVQKFREILRSEQQESHEQENINGIDALVFIHGAPEDMGLTTEIEPILKNHGIDYILPMGRKSYTQPADIRQDIENNILNCDAVLILYEQTTLMWVREQLGACRRLQRKRETPLKVIAVHKDKDQPDIDCHFNNLQVYICPPENIASYLQHFIKALA